MVLCKYMSADGALRFLRSWELRITPPAEFNDPFELRPPAGQMFTEAYVNREFNESAPQMIVDELVKQWTPTFGAVLNPREIQDLVICLLPNADPALERKVLSQLVPRVAELAEGRYLKIQQTLRAQYPSMIQQAKRMASAVLPTFNSIVQHAFVKAPAMLGVLCLSRNSNQPLMWAHYAESHRGLMIEFNGAHPAFNRKRSEADDFGYLRPVVYSRLRPQLSMNEFDQENAFEVFALTKSHHWSYEEEHRLLWPLRSADRSVDLPNAQVRLISCPPDAVLSVTLGCKASSQTMNEVHRALSSNPQNSHISVRQAQLDDVAFDLSYGPCSPQLAAENE